MLRIAILLVMACVVFRWAFGQWPWQSMRTGSAGKAALARARGLLGVEKGASREDIIAAHRRVAALVHPDRGGTHDAMHEANAARDLLLAQLPPGPPAIQDRDDNSL